MALELIKQDVEIDPITKCWNWKKGISSSGYGMKNINGVPWGVHRYVLSLFETLEEGEIARHKCHNRKCCNPEHLMKGSYKDNYYDSLDAYEKGNEKKRLPWFCNGKEYKSCRELREKTGLSMHSIIKYTNENRIFDINAYRKSCIKSYKTPVI